MIQEHEIVLYQVEGTNICVNVVFKDETFWMTQKAMAELFDVNVPAISKHLSNIFEEGEEGHRNIEKLLAYMAEKDMKFDTCYASHVR